MTDKCLLDLRQDIDAIDEHLLSLLTRRADLALQAAKIKKAAGAQGEIYDATREQQIVERLLKLDHGALNDEMVSAIYGTIISACRNLQIQQYALQPGNVTVSVMGIQGSYSETAALRFLAQNNLEAFALTYDITSQQVVEQVMSDKVNYGVVGISNSTAGLVQETLAALANKACKIYSVITLPVNHQLMVLPGVKTIKAIYSHEQALTQCQNTLASLYPAADLIPYEDTALAAKDLAAGKLAKDSAVIANASCASIYKLSVIATNIIDKADNATTFLVVGQTSVLPS